MDAGSDHPLALAIVERAKGLELPTVADFLNIEGKGASASVHGEPVYLGNWRLMDDQKISLGGLEAQAETLKGVGRTVIHVALVGKLLGLIAIANAPRRDQRRLPRSRSYMNTASKLPC